jgi:membrane protein implicated in regulation of membrane protease activity
VNPWFWAWISLVVVFALGETVTGGLLVLPWAFGAGVAALLDALGFRVGWQWLSCSRCSHSDLSFTDANS